MTQRARSSIQVLIQVITLAVFWIACVSTLRPHEMIVGAGAVALSAASCVYVIRTLRIRFRPTVKDLAQVWHLPWDVVHDLIVIGAVLIRDLFGHRAPSLFRSASWGPVGKTGRDTARRVLAIAYTTVAPNCIVIGIDRVRRQILFHQLRKSDIPVLTQRLGAETPHEGSRS
jgi:hypothetical protein